jgi:CheY-like chemotaxis protein
MHNSIPINTKITEGQMLPVMNKMPTILLIDDDDIFIFLTKRMLMNTGLVTTIHVCKSAIDAVQFLSTQKNNEAIPDMIFLDLNMPGMDGWEFLENYQLLLPKMKNPPLLYVISSSIAENDYKRAMNIHGVNGYLSKPLEVTQIKTLLQKAS